MPELPDLEVFSHNLQKKLSGKTLDKVQIINHKSSKTSTAELNKTLAKQELKKVYREGKELRFLFANKALLGMHLMLHGKLFITDGETAKHSVAELLFTDGTHLSLTDFQGMASLSLNPEEKEAPDALSEKLTVAYLQEKLGATRAAIKNVLLDQHVIRGIGNAYADEILWDARISPFSYSNKIPKEKVTKLLRSIHSVLQDAEKSIRKINPDIISGEMRDFMLIHQHAKTHSPTGGLIQHKTTGARKTYFTDEQDLYQ